MRSREKQMNKSGQKYSSLTGVYCWGKSKLSKFSLYSCAQIRPQLLFLCENIIDVSKTLNINIKHTWSSSVFRRKRYMQWSHRLTILVLTPSWTPDNFITHLHEMQILRNCHSYQGTFFPLETLKLWKKKVTREIPGTSSRYTGWYLFNNCCIEDHNEFLA